MNRKLPDLLKHGRSKADALALASLVSCVMDYAQMIAGNATIAGEAKADLTFLFNACKSFLKRLRAEPGTQKEVDEALCRDTLAFASIFQTMTLMNEVQRQGVEQLCLGIASGEVDVTMNEGIVSIGFKKTDY